MCRKASREFECGLFDWSHENTQTHAMRRRDEEERNDVGGTHPMAVQEPGMRLLDVARVRHEGP